MNKNIFFSILLLTFSFNIASSQNDTNFWNNVRFGGGFNVGLGNNFTTIAISPSAVYDFSEKFSAGMSVSYLHSKNKRFDNSLNVYGASVLSLYNVIDGIQLSGEFEELYINQRNDTFKNSYWNPALYFGASYRTGAISIGMRYDVLYDENKSIYSSPFTPIFRVFF